MISVQPSTPLMQQYFALKQQYPQGLLFFQVGDFYELFFEDAQQASACLAITLTARGKNNGDPIPLCGVPIHAKDFYVAKLVRNGFKVIICDQLEPAVPGKVVARGITSVYTPGTLTDSQLLDAKSASYLASISTNNEQCALVFVELLTGTIHATHVKRDDFHTLSIELMRFGPDEIVIQETIPNPLYTFIKQQGYYSTFITPSDSQHTHWLEQFAASIQQLLQQDRVLYDAFAMLFGYLEKNHHKNAHIKHCSIYSSSDFMLVDPQTQKHLELLVNMQDGTRKNSLLDVLDQSVTPMGTRTIKKWLLRPLVDSILLNQRYDMIECLLQDLSLASQLKECLQSIGDAERTVGRVLLNRATLQDYRHILAILESLPALSTLLYPLTASLSKTIHSVLGSFEQLRSFLQVALAATDQDYYIKPGFNQQLDQMRELITCDASILYQMELQEQAATGIASLKIRYNNIQGYYIEVTKANLNAVPSHYIRLQTLVGKERFTTPELKQLEDRISNARLQADNLEQHLYETLKKEVAGYNGQLRRMAQALAHLDGLMGLWQVAYNYGYVRPTFNTSNEIIIEEGRHPIIERNQERFIANSVCLTQEQSLWIITGPNMGGKSTFLRQTALICLLAQIGSFVPAKSASISLRDRIFARIGASDNVAGGESTFLVEMKEAATICKNATPQSLVILDEIGRGTSTFDGMVIAQAILEYIVEKNQARSLFATHYHELTALAQPNSSIVNYCAESIQMAEGIRFTYRICPGVAQGSFGIEVAKLAGLPSWIIERAQHLLKSYT